MQVWRGEGVRERHGVVDKRGEQRTPGRRGERGRGWALGRVLDRYLGIAAGDRDVSQERM